MALVVVNRAPKVIVSYISNPITCKKGHDAAIIILRKPKMVTSALGSNAEVRVNWGSRTFRLTILCMAS